MRSCNLVYQKNGNLIMKSIKYKTVGLYYRKFQIASHRIVTLLRKPSRKSNSPEVISVQHRVRGGLSSPRNYVRVLREKHFESLSTLIAKVKRCQKLIDREDKMRTSMFFIITQDSRSQLMDGGSTNRHILIYITIWVGCAFV